MIKIFLNKIQDKVKRKIELFLVFLLILFSVFITQFYNLNKKIVNENYLKLINNLYFQKSLDHLFNNLNPKYTSIEHKIMPNETFDKILMKYKISTYEIENLKEKISTKKNLNNLKTNQVMKFTLEESKNKRIIKFLFPLSKTEKILLTRDLENDDFDEKKIITNLNKKIIFKEGKISQSLYKTAVNLDIKPSIIIEFARIYGFQIDFQRDIRNNDNFQIMYEVFVDEKDNIFDTGSIIFADLNLRGQSNALYLFKKKNLEEHFDSNGKSIKKALMKTPINGARLSSRFGMRKHPIDGFTKMHRGTDFAAPTGTPIMASGDGVIVKAGWCGGGGNCIKIKHNSIYSTIYAHMSKFASGIRNGIRVKQSQIIGYVGSTGKSTGPHLHYEVVKNGKKINSQTLKLPSGKVLTDKDRELFEIQRIKLDVLKSELIVGLN